MARSISLFSGYSQKENRTTNYCLLVLRLIYEENPKFLGEFLDALIGEGVGSDVGVRFLQQQVNERSVPDGVLEQLPITVFVETKNWDWFYTSQLESHLEDLVGKYYGRKVLLALSNFERDAEARFAEIRAKCEKRGVTFAAVTFEDFLDSIPGDRLPKNLADTLSEFREYLDNEELLPSWRTRLDVVNCAATSDAVERLRVYACPASGGPYTHRRSRFFGAYRRKSVPFVAEILAAVEVRPPEDPILRWKNVQEADPSLISAAEKRLAEYPMSARPALVLVLGEIFQTRFEKTSKGGLFGSKKYFDVEAESTAQLAERLRDQTWESLQLVD